MEKIPVIQETEESTPETKIMNLSETYWKDYLKEQNYNKDVNQMCALCIKEQIDKYGKQTIPCSGLNSAEQAAGDQFEQIVSILTEQERKEMDAIFDPYTYMELFLDSNTPAKQNGDNPLEDRWYQKLISRCLHGDSLVSMHDGSLKKIKDIKIGDRVVSYNETKRSTPINKVTNVWNQGVKPVYRITLENGDYLDCTKDHPILSHFKSGKENQLLKCPSYEVVYKSIEDGLDIGTDVYTLNKSPVWGKFNNIDIAKLLGYIVTDGYVQITEKRKRVQFSNIRKEYVDEFKEICERVFNCSGRYSITESYTHKETKVNRKQTYCYSTNSSGTLNDFLISIGCTDKTNREKNIFDFVIENFDEDCTKVFVNRAYSGDGSICISNNKQIKISLHGSYKSYFICNWPRLLRKIGCWKSVVRDKISDKGSSSNCQITSAVSSKALLNFTGPIFGKEKKSLEILNRIDFLERDSRSLKRGRFKTSTRTKIVSIEYTGNHETFDIEVDKRHNFIANNIIVHNCSAKSKVIRLGRRSGKTYMMALMMIHEMLLNPSYKILLVSPYAVQTEEVVSTFKNLCSRLPENPIIKSKQSPVHVIEFNNGSILKGFTAATNADAVRGQTGHRIVLDECLVGSSQILMSNGDTKSIENIKIGDMVLSEINNKLEAQPVIDHAMTGIKPVFKYVFENKYELIATENHPVFTSKGEMPISEAKDIKVAMIKNEYVKLVEVIPMGEKPVYNITVAKSHNYIANGLLTHNCDDIPETAITSIMAIRMSVRDVKVWRSGTPKGERNLYRSEQDPQNKCFHYPSFVIPHYDDELDESLRHEMGDGIGYVQEVMAIMGLATNSVFQSMFINRAQNKITRVTAADVMADRSRFIVFIGVDWNHDEVGSRLLVIAYDKITPQFHIIEKEKVAIEGFTQYAAVEKIIKLNRKYNCDHVFVDQGFGASQIAQLKQFALSQVGIVPKGHADLKLLDITPVDYGSSTEVRDPVTGDLYKTPTKQMAVMNAVEVFEKDYITLDAKEDHEIILQLKNYIEKSRNKGRIVYGYVSKKIGDHDLDALMIGLFGIKRLYSSLFVGESTQALLKLVTLNEDGTIQDKISKEPYEAIVGYSFGGQRRDSSRNNGLRTYERNITRRTGRSSF